MSPFIHLLYTFITIYTPMYTRYTCIYTTYTPLNTSKHPLNTPYTPHIRRPLKTCSYRSSCSRYVNKYFSLYLVYVQCKSFALTLTFYLFVSIVVLQVLSVLFDDLLTKIQDAGQGSIRRTLSNKVTKHLLSQDLDDAMRGTQGQGACGVVRCGVCSV